MPKRIVALILAFALSFTLSSAALASNTDMDVEAQYQYTDDSIVFVEGGTQSTTQQNRAHNTDDRNTDDIVSYSYAIELDETSEDFAYVTLDFLWDTGDNVVVAQTIGTVDSYQISDGRTLWEGVLKGATAHNGAECTVLVGFSKLNDSTAIQANVTIQTNDELIAMFSFGETIQSEALMSEIENSDATRQQKLYVDQSAEKTALSSGGYTPIASNVSEYTVGNNTRDVLTTSAFFDPINNRCVINLQSDTEMMKELFSVAYSVDVKQVSYSLVYDYSKENSGLVGNNVANIDGFWGVAPLTHIVPEDDGSYFVVDLFSSILETAFDYFCGNYLPVKLGVSFLPISSNVVDAVKSLFEEATGYVLKDSDSTYHTLTIDYGDKTGLHYNDSGMPTVFVIDAGPNFNPGQSAYFTATTAITYRITTIGGGTAPGTRFYIAANGGLDSFGLPLAT